MSKFSEKVLTWNFEECFEWLERNTHRGLIWKIEKWDLGVYYIHIDNLCGDSISSTTGICPQLDRKGGDASKAILHALRKAIIRVEGKVGES